jgi:hypothetical protein
MRINFKSLKKLLLYPIVNKVFTTENVLSVRPADVALRTIIVTSLLLSSTYGNPTTDKSISLDLTPQNRSYINSLQDNTDQIPAWLVAQLLHISNSLADKLKEPGVSLPLVELNELLANPAHYRGKVVAIRTLYAKSSNVNELLQLAPDEQGWSTLLIDVNYHHAIQLFTSQDPSKFQKSQAVYAIGVFLTTRLDQPEKGTSTQSIVVPVIIGTLLPIGPELPIVKNKKIFNFLAPIILLTVIYIFVKIYIARSAKMKLSLQDRLNDKNRKI